MLEIIRRPALPHPPLGGPGTPLSMAALPEGHVLHVLGAPTAQDLGERLATLGDGQPTAIRPLSPGQWFIVGDAVLEPAEIARRASEIGDIAALSDQSHGRVRLSLAGPAAEAALSRGTAVDVSQAAFPVGRSAQTLVGHVGVHLTRTGADRFELMVLRSFAQSLWDDLKW